MPVVYGMAQNSGDGSVEGARSAFYGYTEAMYHHLGRGFQGFRTIVSNNVAPSGQTWRQLRTTTTFHQKFPLTGRIEQVETKIPGTGRLIKRETDTWICNANRGACPQGDALPNPSVNTNGGTVYSPLLDSQRIENYDLGTGAAVSHITTVNAAAASGGASGWDSNGNLHTQVVTSADDGAGGSFVSEHRVTTTNTYIPADTGSWWLDRLSSSHVVTSLTFDGNRKLPNGNATAPTRTVDTSYLWNSPDRTPQSQTVTAAGKTLTTTYNYASTTARGLPSSVTITGTDISPPRATQFTYTKDGDNPATQQDGYFVLTTTNAAEQTSTTQHSPRDGQVTEQTDPNGLSSTSSYDGFGRLTGMSFTDADNQPLLPPVSVSYARCIGGKGSLCDNGNGYGEGDNQDYAAWRVSRVQAGSPTSVDWFDVLGRTIKHVERGFGEYDENGQPIGNGDFIETTTDYDAMGTVSMQSTPFKQGNGQTPYLTAWNYDALNRPTQKNAPGAELDQSNGNVVTSYAYNGSKTTIKVRAASVSSTSTCPSNTNSSNANLCMDMSRSYDVLGRLEQTVQGNGSNLTYAATNYWYDGLGNPIAAKDAGGSVLTATYNDLGQRTDLVDPDAGHWQFTYNALGEVIDQTDARGVVTHHEYDVLGRLRTRTATNNGASDPSLKVIQDDWVYDPSGGAGLLDYAARKKGSSTFALAQIWKESNTYESNTKRLSTQTTTPFDNQNTQWITSYTYDSYGRPFTTGYPSGLMVRKDYTSYGDLNQLSNYGTGAIYWTGSAKDAWGNLTDESWAGGITGKHSAYASTGQLKQKKWTQGASTLDQLDYSYDSFGNLKTQSSTQNGATASESYAYDGLQRLTQTTRNGVPGNPAPVTYRYQNNGNLSAKSDYSFATPGSYVYGNGSCGPHAVSAVVRAGSALTYSCDANGNVTGGSALNATYDFNNQPWSIQRLSDSNGGSGSAQFAYSANGDVFKTLAGSNNTWFGAAGYEESWIGGTLTQRHELGPVTVLRQSGVDTIKAVLRDRLGSQVMSLAVEGSGGGGGLTAPTLSSLQNPSYDGNYTLKWTPINGATEYQLFEIGAIRGAVLVYQGSATLWSPPAAKAPRQYAYQVKACNSTCSDLSQPFYEDVVPLPPDTVTASPPSTAGNFQVSWAAASGANNYGVEEKPPGATSFQAVASGVTTTYWDANARSNGTWQYRIKSCLSTGACGNPSAAISVTVGGDPQVPGAPHMNPPGAGSSGGQISLSWSPAPSPSPQPDYYVLRESFNGGGWSYSVQNGTDTVLERGDGDYNYNIRGCRNNPSDPGNPYCGAFSNTVSVTVAGSTLPDAPAYIHSSQLSCATGTTATYTIDWPASNGATRYELHEHNGMADPQDVYYTTTTETQQTITKTWPRFAESTSFEYEVRACNGNGCSFYTGGASACFDHNHRPESVAPTTTAYDAFGKVRNGDYSDRVGGQLNLLPDTLRGFTGHQHVDDVRLIHMNGRVYDYELGRFLSVDPVIQFPTSTQSMNPYSYIMNNPLSGRDPTGYAACLSTDPASCLDDGVNTMEDVETGKTTTIVVGNAGDNIAFTGQMSVSNFKSISGSINVAFNPSNGADSWVKNGPDGSNDHDKIGAIADSGKGCAGGIQCYNVASVQIPGQRMPLVTSFERTFAPDQNYGAINGIMNEVGRAMGLMAEHVHTRFGADSYTLAYNPTEGMFKDLVESLQDKLGWTSNIARGFSGVLTSVNHPMSWDAHSQGGAIFAEAARVAANGGANLSNITVAFDSGANNAWATNRILARGGIQLFRQGYFDRPNDLVPQILGLRGWNRPDRMARSILNAPKLFGPGETSPHTYAVPNP
ncbi:MAG TPA: RHS repeat-associated core domain-containing protein [Dokdonella sp.]|uniref:RHS repeat-associated core domain-containing protein n=1 Tax=Dokdonella sp. TaxID=2291710 RepID=UPI002D8013CE|nr:RHS repeat-associated core domain-containing protein [Dokdonella sp.]HET9034086.1 RHS repeat-associated core domain-containing protein [Dokdonella sp.]